MSLDVYLHGPAETQSCRCVECGNEHTRVIRPMLFDANITHNLNQMADAAGIYKALWRPSEIGITKAGDLVGVLTIGLAKLKADPEHFKKYNPPNGWGNYDGFVEWVANYLQACREYPDAEVNAYR